MVRRAGCQSPATAPKNDNAAATPIAGAKPALMEGYDRAEWILIDYFDFIVHIFLPATREFYGLERLWGDAEKIEVK